MNGYAVNPPPVYQLVSKQSQRLPDDPTAFARIHREVPSLRWVLLHRDRIPPEARGRWDAALTAAGLARAAEFGDAVVWRMPGRPG